MKSGLSIDSSALCFLRGVLRQFGFETVYLGCELSERGIFTLPADLITLDLVDVRGLPLELLESLELILQFDLGSAAPT